MEKSEYCQCCDHSQLSISTHLFGRYWFQVLVGGILAYTLSNLQIQMNLFPNFWLSALGGFLYILGFVFDTGITHWVVQLKTRFDALGLDFPVVERNPFLPDYPQMKNMLFNWGILFELVLFGMAIWIPGFAVAAIAMRLLAVLGNLSTRKSLLQVLKTQKISN